MMRTDDQQDWPQTMDAKIWRDAFLEEYPEMDRERMLAWFDHAIMAGYEWAMTQAQEEP